MTWTSKYAFAITPPIIFFALWKIGIFSYHHFGCQGNIKNLAPCSIAGFDLLPWLGFSMGWSAILFWLSLAISVFFLIDIGAKHIGSKRGVL
ncbi:hypothetical protein EAW52_25080 [Pseudomonas sp. LTJR-52]|nr:hypothetical protein EAW52_25080 [Pseudomonas sp. LTJR-52]